MRRRPAPDHDPPARVEAEPIHAFAWDVFQQTTALAKRLGLYGAGQDLLSDAFSGNLRGIGPGYAELEFEPRPSETVLRPRRYPPLSRRSSRAARAASAASRASS